MNDPPALDHSGVEGEILWHLSEIEKGLLKKEPLPTKYIGVPLPKTKVSWRQNKQGKEKTRPRKTLPLTSLPPFRRMAVWFAPWKLGRARGYNLAHSGKCFTRLG
jgi:hypothetical protein